MPRANRGEVWLVDLGMAAKARPALILDISFNDDETVFWGWLGAASMCQLMRSLSGGTICALRNHDSYGLGFRHRARAIACLNCDGVNPTAASAGSFSS